MCAIYRDADKNGIKKSFWEKKQTTPKMFHLKESMCPLDGKIVFSTLFYTINNFN